MEKIKIMVVILVIIGCIALGIGTDHSHRANITAEINQKSCQVIDIEYKTVFSKHPFHWVNSKTDWIYKVTYQDGSKEKIAWVVFRGFSKGKWDWENDDVKEAAPKSTEALGFN